MLKIYSKLCENNENDLKKLLEVEIQKFFWHTISVIFIFYNFWFEF